jgi:hypothetical protein
MYWKSARVSRVAQSSTIRTCLARASAAEADSGTLAAATAAAPMVMTARRGARKEEKGTCVSFGTKTLVREGLTNGWL